MSKTIKIRIDTGALQLGDVPPETVVEIEFHFLHGKELRAPLGDVFIIEDDGARNRALIERVARHGVASWSIGPLDVDAVERFLVDLYEEEPGMSAEIINRIADRERAQRPKLVDAEELGNA